MTIPEIRERLDWVVELTDLGDLLLKPPYEISGGQKQRVALAAVLAMQPKILILDEPTSMLDPVSRMRIFDVLGKLKKEQNNTVIAIEHSLENLIPLTDRMILLADGKLALDDETPKFFQNMDLLLESGVIPPGSMLFFHELAKSGDFKGNFPLTIQDASDKLHKLFK